MKQLLGCVDAHLIPKHLKRVKKQDGEIHVLVGEVMVDIIDPAWYKNEVKVQVPEWQVRKFSETLTQYEHYTRSAVTC